MIIRKLFGRGADDEGSSSTDEADPEPDPAVEAEVPPAADELAAADAAPATDGIRRISAEIETLPAEELRFVAGYSYVLARVALADHDVNEAELTLMERALTDVGHLTEAQAVLVVEVARNMAVLYGATEDFVVTREFAASSTRAQREDLLRTAFTIGLADHDLSAVESSVLDEIGKELGFRADEVEAFREETHAHVVEGTDDGPSGDLDP